MLMCFDTWLTFKARFLEIIFFLKPQGTFHFYLDNFANNIGNNFGISRKLFKLSTRWHQNLNIYFPYLFLIRGREKGGEGGEGRGGGREGGRGGREGGEGGRVGGEVRSGGGRDGAVEVGREGPERSSGSLQPSLTASL